MFTLIQGETANDIWTKAFDEVMKSSEVYSRAGNTKELLHVALSINDPIQRWISQKYPPINISYALADLICVLSGSDDASIINYWNRRLPQFAGNYSNYPGAYGKRIKYRFDIDQLEGVFDTLNNHPESRQAVILIWDPTTDLPQKNGKPNNEDIPCNICSMIKVRKGKLEWTQIMRSNDLIMGFPYDIILFTSLQEIIASWLNVEVGTYNHISDSLHIYDNKTDIIEIRENKVNNTDSLKIAHDDYHIVIDQMFNCMQHISESPEISGGELIDISKLDTGYEAYNNILKIICAYAANKTGNYYAIESIIKECTNTAFTEMWKSWLKKYSGGR